MIIFFDQKIKWSGIKDIKVINNNLYVSLTKEVKKIVIIRVYINLK